MVGEDALGREALWSLDEQGLRPPYAIDCSSSARRVVRLLQHRRIRADDVARMAYSELLRRWRGETRQPPWEPAFSFRTNAELLDQLEALKPQRVVMYRAGLVIGRAVLETGIPIFNIHCAMVPDFGGLASIPRAIRAAAWEQDACLHRVVESIDSGEVLAREPFVLDGRARYSANEEVSYAAGRRLLVRTIRDFGSER